MYEKIEPHLQPFFRTAYPIILQTIGLAHGIYSTERGFEFQERSFKFQQKAHEQSVKLQEDAAWWNVWFGSINIGLNVFGMLVRILIGGA